MLGILIATAASALSPRCLIIGGTGRIGTSVATHLLTRYPSAQVVLAGRSEERGAAAVQEVCEETSASASVEVRGARSFTSSREKVIKIVCARSLG